MKLSRWLSVASALWCSCLMGCYEPPDFEADNPGAGGNLPPGFIPGDGDGDGDGDGGTETCKNACGGPDDCVPGLVCLSTLDGDKCLPPQCDSVCFAMGAGCFSDDMTCAFEMCGEPDPNFSDTCKQPCNGPQDCNAGETCLNSANGQICLPPECQNCWNAELSCVSSDVTCDFGECVPP